MTVKGYSIQSMNLIFLQKNVNMKIVGSFAKYQMHIKLLSCMALKIKY